YSGPGHADLPGRRGLSYVPGSAQLLQGHHREHLARAVREGYGSGERAADHAEALPDDAAAWRQAAPAVLPRWQRRDAGGCRGALQLVPQARAQRAAAGRPGRVPEVALRSEEHTSELQSRENLVCRLLLEKK